MLPKRVVCPYVCNSVCKYVKHARPARNLAYGGRNQAFRFFVDRQSGWYKIYKGLDFAISIDFKCDNSTDCYTWHFFIYTFHHQRLRRSAI